MPRMVSLATAVPPYCFEQQQLREMAHAHFLKGLADIDRLITVFDSVQVRRRFFSVPAEWFAREHTFVEKNNEYIRQCEALACGVAADCLGRAGVEAGQVDHIVFASNSGLATPSMDARLINRMGFDRHVRRTPIFGLGCAGGAAALSRCRDLALAYPSQRILLVCVELSSLTFQSHDYSKSNLVATALFGDGAAAVLVCGDACPGEGIEIVKTQSTLWRETLDVMGWDFSELGLTVIFSRAIPHIIRKQLRDNLLHFLDGKGLGIADLSYFLIHPGGARILDAVQEVLELEPDSLGYSRHVLENYGNMSAPTVLFILDHMMEQVSPRRGDYALMAAFGPGFSSELILLGWG